jgi:hypothetical protein
MFILILLIYKLINLTCQAKLITFMNNFGDAKLKLLKGGAPLKLRLGGDFDLTKPSTSGENIRG